MSFTMQRFLLFASVGIAALVLYKAFTVLFIKVRNAARARQLGCQPAPAYPDVGFLGLKHLRQLLAADTARQFPDFLEKRQEVMNEKLGRVCSTFSFNLLGQTIFFTSDPENIKAMLASQFADFGVGSLRKAILSPMLGDGIFTQDADDWFHSRALLRPNFVRDQISDLDMEERHVNALLKTMPVGQDGWTEFLDIQTRFFRLTIDTATEFLFGESVDSQLAEANNVQLNKSAEQQHAERAFSINFDRGQYHMARKFRFGDLQWLHRPAEYTQNGKIVNEFIQKYVDIALSRNSKTTTEKDSEMGKEKYIFLQELAKRTQDPVELRAQLLNILLAGRDTTSSLLSWMFHQLVRNPSTFHKLRGVIIETFGTYENPRDITFATLKGCQYLQYCINETLRLWTVVHTNGRRANKVTTLPRGGGPDGKAPILLPKDTEVNYSIHVTHRRKDIWGEDAREFKPERFIGRRSGWEFLPFNGGPRICIGQQFALTEASYVMVRLLQKFDNIESVAGEFELPVTSNATLTNCPERPVTLKLHAANV